MVVLPRGLPMAETLSSAVMAAGLSWASGVRLYMALFAAGLFGRVGWLTLPQPLRVLESPWVLGITVLLFVAEFLADKVPGFDSIWDAVHTFIRIPAGAILAAAAMGQMDPSWVAAAGILGGAIATGAHLTKAGSRALINTSPEPFSNWTASFSEDAIAAVVLWSAFFHPWLLLGFLAVFFLFAAWLLPRLWRGLRLLFFKFAS